VAPKESTPKASKLQSLERRKNREGKKVEAPRTNEEGAIEVIDRQYAGQRQPCQGEPRTGGPVAGVEEALVEPVVELDKVGGVVLDYGAHLLEPHECDEDPNTWTSVRHGVGGVERVNGPQKNDAGWRMTKRWR
jgi:hypothetical protein